MSVGQSVGSICERRARRRERERERLCAPLPRGVAPPRRQSACALLFLRMPRGLEEGAPARVDRHPAMRSETLAEDERENEKGTRLERGKREDADSG